MFKRKKYKRFNWQINASAVGKIMGFFGPENALKALANTWHMNLKRMPRFGVQPSVDPHQKTTEQIAEETLKTPVYNEMVSKGVTRAVAQEKIVHEMKRVAIQEAQTAATKEVAAVESLHKLQPMVNYTTKRTGVQRAAIGHFFTVGVKVYHKTSPKYAVLSDMDKAAAQNWSRPIVIEAKREEVQQIRQQTQQKRLVANHMETTAKKIINVTRGQRKELSDLEIVRQKYANVIAGNDKAYFLNVAGGGFVIGKIDGIDHQSGTIYELKHRQSKLFYEFRKYEQVQCAIYMKMLKMNRLTLVETHRQQQCYYHMTEDNKQHYVCSEGAEFKKGVHWDEIQTQLENIVKQLNRAEADATFRQTLLNVLYK
jgi:hypothetical protein